MAVKANYETVMIISMKNGEENIQATIEKFKALIEKQSDGYYVLMNFESEAQFPAELDRVYKITDGILRSIVIKKGE